MNILVITNKLPYPPKDGGAIATLSLAKNLAEHAKSIDILAINTSKHYFDIDKIPAELTKRVGFADYYINTDLKLTKLVLNLLFSKYPYNAERFLEKGFGEKIKEQLRQKKYDIIQLEGLYVMPYIDVIRSETDALVAYRAHNIEHEIWQRTLNQTNGFVKKTYIKILSNRIRKMEKSYINKYDLLVPITDRDKNKLSEFGNTKPSLTISTGINTELYQVSQEPAEPNSLFHIGALDWSPNQEGLLWFIDNCWAKIQKQNPNIKFYIAGRNAPDWLKKHFDKKNIVFLGEIDDAHAFMNSKMIMVVPLLSGSGMRIKIVEAMALAKPIVTTDVGIEGIHAENHKHAVIANTADQIAEQIISLTNNPKKIEEIGNNAKIFVSENFDNLAISKKLYDFYVKHLKNSDL